MTFHIYIYNNVGLHCTRVHKGVLCRATGTCSGVDRRRVWMTVRENGAAAVCARRASEAASLAEVRGADAGWLFLPVQQHRRPP